MMFLGRANAGNECRVSMLRKLGNFCCGHKMFLNKIRNSFCVRNKCCARGQTGKHLYRQRCVRNNVSSFARALRDYFCELTCQNRRFFIRLFLIKGRVSLRRSVESFKFHQGQLSLSFSCFVFCSSSKIDNFLVVNKVVPTSTNVVRVDFWTRHHV